MQPHKIEARDLPDLWFQAVYYLLENGKRFKIDKGSYAGQTRLEYDYFIGHVKNPGAGSGTPGILPDIPKAVGVPNPVDFDYVYGGPAYTRSYLEYIMTSAREPGEAYTYGERLTKALISEEKLAWWVNKNEEVVNLQNIDGKIVFEEDNNLYLNQIEWIIDTYKKHGHRNNQMVLQVAHPSDVLLKDPPCLRSIDTRIQEGALHFLPVYFRSWDLWGGLPANLAGIQELKKYMADAIGVKDGEMLVESKGLHLYGYAEDLAKMRCNKEIVAQGLSR